MNIKPIGKKKKKHEDHQIKGHEQSKHKKMKIDTNSRRTQKSSPKEHRNQNLGTRSQLRENQKPKVQKPQSKPTENQIAKMSPQTPNL